MSNADANFPESEQIVGGADAVDKEQLADEADYLVTNDAVAGETVFDGSGDGNDGPTGGAPGEGEPDYAENDLVDEDIDLDDEP